MPLKDARDAFRNFGAGSKKFLESNTLVAKFAIIILVLIGFVLLLRLGTELMQWILSPTKSPYLIRGRKSNTKELTTISQGPAGGPNTITIVRSANERYGIEFTWSTWIFISGLAYKSGSLRHIFSKGNGDVGDDGLMMPNNAPGLYLHPKKNSLVVIMNTYSTIDEEVVVDDVPLNKWLNVMIRVEGNILDVYVNGTIAVRHKLSGVPKQNYGDVWVTANGGFDGELADLRYFDYGLNTTEISTIVDNGPDMSSDRPESQPVPHYFALQWYLNNATGR